MTINELFLFSPHIFLGIAAVFVMLQIAFKRSHHITYTATIVVLLITSLLTFFVWPQSPKFVTGIFVMDTFAAFFIQLILIASISVVIFHKRYADAPQHNNEVSVHREVNEEFYLLLLLASLGGCLLVSANHAVSFFLGIELVSIAALAMLGYARQRSLALESAFKYLIMSGVGTAFMLMGLALLFARSGSLQLTTMLTAQSDYMVAIGMLLILVGVGFKLSLVPFHWWTPDVYQGAPATATMYIATVSKTAVFAALLRIIVSVDTATVLFSILSVIAVLSMVIGNLLALKQSNLKRLLAYSAIAHMGYVLVAAILAINLNSYLTVEASSYYLLAYLASSIIAFSVMTALSSMHHQQDVESLSQYQGLFWHSPWLAIALVLAFLSMAGMPLTIGFIGKFYLLNIAINQMAWWLVSAMVLGSIIGLYYYLRVIFSLFAEAPETQTVTNPPSGISLLSGVWLTSVTVALVLFGVLPEIIAKPIASLILG
ncbi:NADH-quinone oxidoreductase subunit N [Flocculibacter collagenilyticus]|uniref:NADH-quinone oxidoreductase subunit N n=1 Tax=Flocculibacter collagenilyticus TaxID=2744479 RepID=UPI0018F28B29|nr:NADH-quinone oxidoreductase subunit N [Flocculibacter collagenilyticus]